ncbi:MAG: Ig-like domain-containing protein, partial [Rhodoglobus sp.]
TAESTTSTQGPIASPTAPAAPAVFASVDPDALRPPTLTGSAAPGALIVITDELGSEVSRTVADPSGAWSTEELSALSPAASSILVRQIDTTGLASLPTIIGPLAPRPMITGPADGFLTYGASPFDITIEGWPGTTVEVMFDAVAAWGYTWPETYPTATVVFDGQGRGVLHIDGSVFWFHRASFHYVDGSRFSPAQTELSFGLTYYPD